MKRLAIYHPGGRFQLGANVFGMSVANSDLFRALAQHGGLDRLDVLTHGGVDGPSVAAELTEGVTGAAEVRTGVITDQALAAQSGAVLRGGPRLEELAWVRRGAVGDRGYSLIGLIHTVAPPAMRQEIAAAAIGPVQPWDALICTSPSIQTAMRRMFDEWSDYLGERFGGPRRTQPQLPLLPLGVRGEDFARVADRPDIRRSRREALGVGPDDIVVLWVGRLSFFEKAFPQAMYRAVQAAGKATGAKVHFALVGWFPGGAEDEQRYRQAAELCAPDVRLHVLDGNDRDLIGEMWAASDIFLSLVDNVQETFGITPLEAMAAGLPVVVSDWDGYRYTVRDGEVGMLVPTLIGPAQNLLEDVATSHALAVTSYQSYVGTIAQHTAVHVGRATDALVSLIRSPDLRVRMGQAGRRRIREVFDWKVVAPQYRELAQHLSVLRTAGSDAARGRKHPVKGDPFRDFSGFATDVLGLDDQIWLADGATADDPALTGRITLDQFASARRATQAEATQIIRRLAAEGPKTVRDVLIAFPTSRRKPILLGLLWMAKAGVLDWRIGNRPPPT